MEPSSVRGIFFVCLPLGEDGITFSCFSKKQLVIVRARVEPREGSCCTFSWGVGGGCLAVLRVGERSGYEESALPAGLDDTTPHQQNAGTWSLHLRSGSVGAAAVPVPGVAHARAPEPHGAREGRDL